MRGAVLYAFVVMVTAALVLVGSANSSHAAVTHTESLTVATVHPAQGEVVGVAHPLIVEFSSAVFDRAAAERSIKVTSPEKVSGSFEWLSHDVVQWVPDQFWPAHSNVSFLAGDIATNFQTGPTVLGVADLSSYNFTVSIDGVVAREMPASMGKPGFATPVGSFTVLEKQRRVMFDSRTIGIPLESSEGYLIRGEYAVRVTWGGVYVHSAPWSVGSQGYANVSHGCINLSPDNAAWYFNTVRNGDPVVVQY